MRARLLASAIALLCAASAGLAWWLATRPGTAALEQAIGARPTPWDGVAGLAWALTGATVTWMRPRQALGWLLLTVGACQVLSVGLGAYGGYGVAAVQPDWPLARWVAWLSTGLWVPGLVPLWTVLLALYPDGRLPGPRWRVPVAACVLATALLAVAAWSYPGTYATTAPGPSPAAAPELAVVLGIAGLVLLAPSALCLWVMSLVRLTRAAAPQRQQLAWLFFVVVPFAGVLAVPGVPHLLADILALMVPVAVGVGILRYHLLGIEVVVRRGVVYACLTGVVVAAYLGATALAGSGLASTPVPGVLAAAIVAVGLTPLRDRLQTAVDHLVYGDRRDPLGAVTRLGHQVAADETELLPAVLAVITSAVRAPAAVVLDAEGNELAVHGSPSAGPAFILRVAGADVGLLRVSERSPGERYTSADLRLLTALAQQVAVVVRALDLAEAVEAERDRVVAVTRSERDRLRRDLHDGLGPSLAGVRLGLAALETAHAAGDKERACELLTRIREEVDTMVGEVRRVIDDLRPAVLDDLGLVGALCRHAQVVSAGVEVGVTADGLPPLPPAVEVAAYRITQEALTNVTRHSAARHAQVTLRLVDDAVALDITDDGAGMAPERDDGVGLASMRQRAQTVGGRVDVTTSASGTNVRVTLPVGAPAP